MIIICQLDSVSIDFISEKAVALEAQENTERKKHWQQSCFD